MSLVPYSWNDYALRPSKIMDDHLEKSLKEWPWNWDVDFPSVFPSKWNSLYQPYSRPWRSLAALNHLSDVGSTMNLDKDGCEIHVDVRQFAPEEITVNVTGNNVTIEGKREEKQGRRSYVSKHFLRRYSLPPGHDMERLVSNLSSDGLLTITAPRYGMIDRNVPIRCTGRIAKALKHI